MSIEKRIEGLERRCEPTDVHIWLGFEGELGQVWPGGQTMTEGEFLVMYPNAKRVVLSFEGDDNDELE